MDTQKRAESREQVWEMCFKTYRDKKSCLSLEIEVPQVEDLDFSVDSLCKLHREFPLKS